MGHQKKRLKDRKKGARCFSFLSILSWALSSLRSELPSDWPAMVPTSPGPQDLMTESLPLPFASSLRMVTSNCCYPPLTVLRQVSHFAHLLGSQVSQIPTLQILLFSSSHSLWIVPLCLPTKLMISNHIASAVNCTKSFRQSLFWISYIWLLLFAAEAPHDCSRRDVVWFVICCWICGSESLQRSPHRCPF